MALTVTPGVDVENWMPDTVNGLPLEDSGASREAVKPIVLPELPIAALKESRSVKSLVVAVSGDVV